MVRNGDIVFAQKIGDIAQTIGTDHDCAQRWVHSCSNKKKVNSLDDNDSYL
jgi:hypothetical protein